MVSPGRFRRCAVSTDSAMHLLSRILWVCALAVLPLAACAEVTEECPGTAPVTVRASVWPSGTTVGLQGVELCETDTTNCVLTDANGEATLCLPFDVETSFTRRKEGYGSYLLALVIPRDGPALHLPLSMATEIRLAAQHNNVMARYPMVGTGMIALEVGPRVAGATFDLFTAAGQKAFYTDEDLNWRLDLTATTDLGLGGFVEVSPGVHQVELGGTVEGCVPQRGWPGRFANSVRFPVLEGHLSDVLVACDVPP